MRNILEKLFSSRTRAEIFKHLFGLKLPEIHIREITRRSGVNVRTVQSELKKLQGLDLILVRKDGNRLYYKANQNHPLFLTLRTLVLRTSGLVDVLADKLANQEIKLAFVYGSIASGDENGRSDVDLFIIGATGLRNLSSLLQGADQEIGREINPFVITPEEFLKRRNANDPFLTRVLSSPKIFVIGSEHELEAMGGERLA